MILWRQTTEMPASSCSCGQYTIFSCFLTFLQGCHLSYDAERPASCTVWPWHPTDISRSLLNFHSLNRSEQRPLEVSELTAFHHLNREPFSGFKDSTLKPTELFSSLDTELSFLAAICLS